MPVQSLTCVGLNTNMTLVPICTEYFVQVGNSHVRVSTWLQLILPSIQQQLSNNGAKAAVKHHQNHVQHPFL